MNKMEISIDDIYVNLILTAVSRRKNFERLDREAERETIKHFLEDDRRIHPEGYEGLYFIELLSRKMGSSLGEVYYLSQTRREEIICDIIEQFKPLGETTDFIFYDEDKNDITFDGTFGYYDNSFYDEQMMNASDVSMPDALKNQSIHTCYDISFRKVLSEDRDSWYSISIAENPPHSSDYVYDSYVIWEGKEGYFAEFIDEVIRNHEQTSIEIDKNDNSTEKYSETIEVEKPVIESEPIQEGPQIIDELVTGIWNDTRTIDVLDKFEGYGQSDPIRYRRIVISNTMFTRHWNGQRIKFNLVIERGKGSDYVGDVTFTQYKKGYAFGLKDHINTEVTDDIIEQYVDKDQFFRFSKPYLLRAQNSSNRTGYGWEWDWSGGIGDYTEGTLYGETTNYFFVGVYLTTGYSYDPSKRKPFISKDQISEDKNTNNDNE